MPERAQSSTWGNVTWYWGPSIQRPGSVKARPPATMAPALMAAWQTLASWRSRLPRARRVTTDARAAKTMGQGRAPILRAMNMELAVSTALPTDPMTRARGVRARRPDEARLKS